MFARLLKHFRQPKPKLVLEKQAKEIRRVTKKLLDALIYELKELGWAEFDLAQLELGGLNVSANNVEENLRSLRVSHPASYRFIYCYLLAVRNLAQVVQRTKIAPMTVDRIPIFIHELYSIHHYVKRVEAHFPRETNHSSQLAAKLWEFHAEISLFNKQFAIHGYRQYIELRTLKERNENRMFRFLRNKFCEFSAEKKTAAAQEMITVLQNPQARLSDGAINALVNGKLGLFTQTYANRELWREMRRRYNPETRTCEIKGLKVILKRKPIAM